MSKPIQLTQGRYSMESQTIGHCANSMGVRGHSAGTIFPAVIMIKGNPFDAPSLGYHIINHPNFDKFVGWHSYSASENHAAYTARG